MQACHVHKRKYMVYKKQNVSLRVCRCHCVRCLSWHLKIRESHTARQQTRQQDIKQGTASHLQTLTNHPQPRNPHITRLSSSFPHPHTPTPTHKHTSFPLTSWPWLAASMSAVCLSCSATHTHTHAHTHACTHTRMHTHTHAHAHKLPTHVMALVGSQHECCTFVVLSCTHT